MLITIIITTQLHLFVMHRKYSKIIATTTNQMNQMNKLSKFYGRMSLGDKIGISSYSIINAFLSIFAEIL